MVVNLVLALVSDDNFQALAVQLIHSPREEYALGAGVQQYPASYNVKRGIAPEIIS